MNANSDPSDLLKQLKVLTFFVTTRCNARCETCFYYQSLNDPKLAELTIEEITRLAATMPPFPHLLLSGGEPVMRNELLEIIAVFVRNNGITTVDIPTNGLLTRRIAEVAETVLEAHPDLLLTIGVSVDGLEETHDRIRGVPGNFRKVMETLDALGKLRARRTAAAAQGSHPFPRLQLVTLTTITNRNIEEVEALAREFADRFDLDSMMFEALRPISKDPTLRPPTPEQHERVVRMALELNNRLYSRHFAAERARRMSYLRGVYRLQSRVLGGGKLPVTCRGGIRLGVIEPDGRVRLCEFLDPVGALRDHDMCWPAVWLGPKAAEQREWIRATRCTCTHCVNLGHSLDDSARTRLLRHADETAFLLGS
jgi:MoaA/NifB/PqqE/SkfB family radical SAM enzyme